MCIIFIIGTFIYCLESIVLLYKYEIEGTALRVKEREHPCAHALLVHRHDDYHKVKV
jgi:hypothetical protein